MSAKLNILKTIQSNRTKEIQESNKANIYCEDSAMYLDINGIPFSIEIVYKGSIYLESNLGLLFRINYASNKITIINAFASQFPKKLFDYKGDIKIIDCQILNYSGGLYKADFKNNALQDLLESQDTKVEDDTLIIRGEQKRPPLPMRTGKASINLSDRNKEKLDKDQLLTIIPKFAEYRRKTAVGKQRVTTPAKKIIKKETIKKTPTKTGGKY